MRILTYLILLTFTTQALACPDYKRLTSGESAPCNGHFFNDQMEKSIRKDVRDNQIRKEQIELKDLQIKELSEDRNNWKKTAEKQAEISRSKDSDFKLGVAAGIGLTLLVIFATGQVSK